MSPGPALPWRLRLHLWLRPEQVLPSRVEELARWVAEQSDLKRLDRLTRLHREAWVLVVVARHFPGALGLPPHWVERFRACPESLPLLARHAEQEESATCLARWAISEMERLVEQSRKQAFSPPDPRAARETLAALAGNSRGLPASIRSLLIEHLEALEGESDSTSLPRRQRIRALSAFGEPSGGPRKIALWSLEALLADRTLTASELEALYPQLGISSPAVLRLLEHPNTSWQTARRAIQEHGRYRGITEAAIQRDSWLERPEVREALRASPNAEALEALLPYVPPGERPREIVRLAVFSPERALAYLEREGARLAALTQPSDWLPLLEHPRSELRLLAIRSQGQGSLSRSPAASFVQEKGSKRDSRSSRT